MIQNLVIIGATGKVGKTLISQIFKREDTNPKIHQNPTRIMGLVSSSTYSYSPNGLDKHNCNEFITRHKKGEKNLPLEELLEKVNKKSKENYKTVFVDVTASDNMLRLHRHIISETLYGVVTANKLPLIQADYDTFQKLMSETERYGYSCSVMAGAGTINFLRNRRDLRDPVKSISGCFSGTLGYLLSEISKGIKFSEALQLAKDKGYTEPDPREDLSGMDVARKLLILSRTAGINLGIKDVFIEPFIPKEYFREESVEEFMKASQRLDEYFARNISSALENQRVPRYVAEMSRDKERPSLKVSLKEVPIGSPLGTLEGTLNKVVISTKIYPLEEPYSIEAPGAGLSVTAGNIRADLLEQLNGRRVVNLN